MVAAHDSSQFIYPPMLPPPPPEDSQMDYLHDEENLFN
jgi:hypothetical protein